MADLDKMFDLPPADSEPLLIGPVETYRVRVDGRIIPRLTGYPTPDGINLTVDGRFCILVPDTLAKDVAWLVAQALAVGEGYPHLEAETKDRPFAPIGREISNREGDDA